MATWGVIRLREARDHARLSLAYVVDDVPVHVQHGLTIANALAKAGCQLEPGDVVVRVEGPLLTWNEVQFGRIGG
ncbi:MAG: hypothetical protein HYU88_13875 [Chloroflexi bacterium]|nr:hypothetical protein [Chloroflexota bacterium]MBI4504937.1 hypothetical protein [Chloroflexota bacterium]